MDVSILLKVSFLLFFIISFIIIHSYLRVLSLPIFFDQRFREVNKDISFSSNKIGFIFFRLIFKTFRRTLNFLLAPAEEETFNSGLSLLSTHYDLMPPL